MYRSPSRFSRHRLRHVRQKDSPALCTQSIRENTISTLFVFKAAFGNEDASEDMISKAIMDLEESGSLEYAWKKALDYHEAAHQALDKINPSPSLEILRTITDFQLTRVR